MRSPLRTGLAITFGLLLTGCAAGPHQLSRSIDDWDQKIYVNSPWLNAAMWVVPIYPVMHVGARAIDFAITDPYYFWFQDAWDGNGTGFRHMHIDYTDGWVDCVLADRAAWIRSEK
jgi:hypothetical protein